MNKNNEDVFQESSYNKLINNLINKQVDYQKINLQNYNIDIEKFKIYFSKNIKKSSILVQILPSVLFLIISLVSFSLVYFSSKFAKFWNELQNETLLVAILMFGLFFMIIGLILLVQKYVLGTRVVFITKGYKRGYHNISKKRYEEIKLYLNNGRKVIK